MSILGPSSEESSVWSWRKLPEAALPDLIEARDVVESFHNMLRRKSKDDLEAWIYRAAISQVHHSPTGSSATGQQSKMR